LESRTLKRKFGLKDVGSNRRLEEVA